jgi:uncharacterized OB-fold protein
MIEIKKEWAFSIPGKLEIPYKYFAGTLQSKALGMLRDEGKFMAVRCPKCKTVKIPPRSHCEICFTKLDELVEVGPEGKLVNWTVVRYKEAIHPRKAPYILGMILLDGADSPITHFVGGVKPEKLLVGMRVKPVFEDTRRGSILDVRHFVSVKR